MSEPHLVVHPDPDILAAAAAARLITRLVDVQAARGSASAVLTGGRVGIATVAAVAASPARKAVDWSRVDLWWGDERFLPAGDPDRNETQARAALLDHLPIDESKVHPMPSADGDWATDPDAAAAAYTAELANATFDVVLLGVGPDAHVASLFPNHPALTESESATVTVRNAPKPPPTRISLTVPAINAADEVWFLVAGEDKAEAVRLALSGTDPKQAPAAAVHGRQRTLWLLDRAAAPQQQRP